MAELVSRIDDWGRPAWIALSVLGLIVFWPIGLAILAYLLWSGRMSVWFHNKFDEGEMKQQMRAWKSDWRGGSCGKRRSGVGSRMGFTGGGVSGGSGNRAFDEYREQTLQRLEDEQSEFHGFLDRLRQAKDREEFDAFMADRRNRPAAPPASSSAPEPMPPAPRG